jgi:hypothetical protein
MFFFIFVLHFAKKSVYYHQLQIHSIKEGKSFIMKTSIVREKMRRGEPVLMAKINFMNPDMAEMIGYAGFDGL